MKKRRLQDPRRGKHTKTEDHRWTEADADAAAAEEGAEIVLKREGGASQALSKAEKVTVSEADNFPFAFPSFTR